MATTIRRGIDGGHHLIVQAVVIQVKPERSAPSERHGCSGGSRERVQEVDGDTEGTRKS